MACAWRRQLRGRTVTGDERGAYLLVAQGVADEAAFGTCVRTHGGTLTAPCCACFADPDQALRAALALKAALANTAAGSLPVMLCTAAPEPAELPADTTGDLHLTPAFRQVVPPVYEPLLWPVDAPADSGGAVLWQAADILLSANHALHVWAAVVPADSACALLEPFAVSVQRGDDGCYACFDSMRDCEAGLRQLVAAVTDDHALGVMTGDATSAPDDLSCLATQADAAVVFSPAAFVLLGQPWRRGCRRLDTAGLFALPLEALRRQHVDSATALLQQTRCFYCTGAHAAAACPSKGIQDPSTAFERLARMPFAQVRALLRQQCAAAVSPRAPTDGTFPDGPAAVAMRAFYDSSILFQLRTLRALCVALPDAGQVLMALDCVRVCRYDDASRLLEQASTRDPHDVRVALVRGFLAIESGRASAAAEALSHAARLATTPSDERYAGLLRIRLYDTLEEQDAVERELTQLHRLDPDDDEVRFHLAIACLHSGKVEHGLRLLRPLVDMSALWLMRCLIAGQRLAVRQPLDDFIEAEISSLRDRARKALHAIQTTMGSYSCLMGSDDPDCQRVAEIQARGAKCVADNCIAGLLDTIDAEGSVASTLHRRADRCRTEFADRLASARSLLAQFRRCTQQTRYPFVVTAHDRTAEQALARSIAHAQESLEHIQSCGMAQVRAHFDTVASQTRTLRRRFDRIRQVHNTLVGVACVVRLPMLFFLCSAVATVLAVVVLGVADSLISGSLGSPAHGYRLLRYGVWLGMPVGGVMALRIGVRRMRHWVVQRIIR